MEIIEKVSIVNMVIMAVVMLLMPIFFTMGEILEYALLLLIVQVGAQITILGLYEAKEKEC